MAVPQTQRKWAILVWEACLMLGLWCCWWFGQLCVCVCLFRAFVWWEDGSVGISHIGWSSFLKISKWQTNTETSLWGYEHTCTETDCSGSVGVFVSVGTTVRQSPAGVAAGHWQLNNLHLCFPTIQVYTQTNTLYVYLGLKKYVCPVSILVFLPSLVNFHSSTFHYLLRFLISTGFGFS